MRSGRPLLHMRNIHVTYEDVHALKGIDFDLYGGEIHALMGEHRAGKSSLVKIMSGAIRKKEGEIIFDGRRINHFTTRTATLAGIGMVYQNLNVIPNLDSVKNVFAGQMIKSRLGFLDYSMMESRTRAIFRDLGLDIDPGLPLYKLSLWQQYMVEFARILIMDPRLIILDEVSNKLTPQEMLPIYRMISRKRETGGSVIYITHNMDEILQLADRVTILKDGYRRGTEIVKDLDKYRLFQLTYSFAIEKKKLGEDARSSAVMRSSAEAIIQHLPLGIVILDSRGRVQLVNMAAIDLLKPGHDPPIRMPLSRLLKGAAPAVMRGIRDALKLRVEGSWKEVQLGGGALVTIQAFPFKSADSGFFRDMLVIQDMSADRSLKNYFVRSEKMASVAEVAVGVAHEINNPLYIIKNSLELIDRSRVDAGTVEKLADIENEVDRIVKIVSTLLSFSRIRESPERRIDLALVLEEVLLLLHHNIAQKNIRVMNRVGEFGVEVLGDENRLKQLFINLINNSIEAVLDEGILEVAVQPKPTERRVKVYINDNGYGIPADIRDNIFKPFFSTKINKRNTGLGLSICRQIVKEHRGEISFESEPGSMTSFCVEFPLA